MCFASIYEHVSFAQYVMGRRCLCGRCRQQLDVLNRRLYYDKLCIHGLYVYNDSLEQMLFQYKEGHDIALAPVFFEAVARQLHDRFRHYTLVLMPSSKEKMIERGFLPLSEMLQGVSLPMLEPFYKINNHKQSLQSLQARADIAQVIKLKANYALPRTKLLLIDDVCTSGSTILHAYHLLRQHTYKIEALSLSVHPLFVESCDKKGLCKRGKFSIL